MRRLLHLTVTVYLVATGCRLIGGFKCAATIDGKKTGGSIRHFSSYERDLCEMYARHLNESAGTGSKLRFVCYAY